ncbi:Coenzyme F420 hydrogenase/dehydrogenase, beta subunit C-terminal domain [Fibrobacter sp.]|uniref:Coenzyme F420 hydrogenase/dehydrogenase, beta subunit C-terminal domain n=1 Tax=Fibrobacter sp. TaxID=35828 RepID=UPI003890F0BE
MRLFLSRICQNVSCDDCHYRKLPRIADITLGDYWGISKYHPEMNDNKGTSVVLLNITPGSMLFESVADKVVRKLPHNWVADTAFSRKIVLGC